MVFFAMLVAACGDDDTPRGAALCEIGEINCEGECVDLDTSVDHCGECGNACDMPDGGMAVCRRGECTIECRPAGGDEDAGGPELTPCEGMCVDLEADVANCGSCDNSCHDPDNGDPVCRNGECEIDCEAGFDVCGNECSNLLVDNEHCGACDEACGGDEVCANGSCVLSCPEGEARCGNTCVNITSDPDNCGGCGNVCPDPGGDAARDCESGTCRVTCSGGKTPCGDTCIDTDTDANHCGACDNQCSSISATPSCSGGSCSLSCAVGFDDCNTEIADGCEADLSDEDNCGDCSTACGGGTPFCTDDVGGPVCSATCLQTECTTPDRCVDLSDDVDDCGACGNACDPPASGVSTGDAACANSLCDVSCRAPTDTKVTLGSSVGCVNTGSDAQACGSGLAKCPKGERCVSSACASDACAVGLTNTDAGCLNLASNGSNCGAPDQTCSGTVVGAACFTGECFCEAGDCTTACTSGLTRCGRDCADTNTDPAHCGGCDAACDPGEFCRGGQCRDFVYASGCWECGAGNDLAKCCEGAVSGNTICVADSSPCP